MLAELYVPAFRTLMCVRRLRGPEGVVVVTDFFLTQQHLPGDALD